VYRQENKLRWQPSPVDLTSRLNPVEDWHGDIQYNRIWLKTLRFRNQIDPVIRSSHYFKVLHQKGQDHVENDIVIVSDKNSRPVQGQPSLFRMQRFRSPPLHSQIAKTTLNLT